MNAHVRDNLSFLYTPPMCRVYNSANISINDATSTALTFDSERFDTDTMHSTSSNTGRITLTTAGKYLDGAHATFADNSTGTRMVNVRLGGATNMAYEAHNATTAGGAGAGSGFNVSTLYSYTAAQYVELVAYQNSGGALNVTFNANSSPELWAFFVGN
mgnify:FL=1